MSFYKVLKKVKEELEMDEDYVLCCDPPEADDNGLKFTKDYDAIATLLDVAGEYGLEVECVLSAFGGLKAGMTIEQACAFGLDEWDV